MTQESQNIRRRTTFIALIVSTMLTVVPPAIYFVMSFSHMRGVVEAEGEINARLVGTLVVANPQMWEFEELRLKELLGRRSKSGVKEIRRIYNLKREVIAESGEPLPRPVFALSFPVHDAGHEVALLEVSRSLQPVLIKTLLALIGGALVGAYAFFRLRTVPLRALDEAYRVLKQSEEKYRSVYESLNEGLALYRASRREDGSADLVLTDVNPAAINVFGFSRDDIGGWITELLDGLFAECAEQVFGALQARGEVSLDLEQNSTGRIFSLTAFPMGYGMVATLLEDVTEKKRTAEQLERLAYYDSLTGLLNRRMLLDRMEQAIGTAQREGVKVATLFMDLNGFKVINDTLGHKAGDQILVEVAKRLQKMVRKRDTLARLGGDEFVVAATFEKDENASAIAKNLINAITPVYQVCDREVYVGVSVGISIFPDDGDVPETLLKNADIAMYNAKSQGQGGFCFYSAQLNERLHERMQLEFKLRGAVEREEFFLEYQPILDSKTGRITAVEALLRWNDPEKGRVMPDSFIPLAEDTGVILPLGEWVLRTACAKLRQWQDAGVMPVRMAVNISGRQFTQGDLSKTVEDALLQSGVHPSWLELELTETCLIKNVEETVRKLCRLKGLCVSISIDDFGTGYSSLQYLKNFPIDHLKIDRGFINNVCELPDDRAIVDAIIGIAKAMDLHVIAEGVETRQQAEHLMRRGCDEFQGYYFYRPLPEEKLLEVLASKAAAGLPPGEDADWLELQA
ncbi:sensor diguanylate cyclase/phosphodiesterase, S-box-containing [Citrifermentans bemidjiense Bem]|uniref:Sensor diguanylate cyclase/phosphodiesterase, S-box-containing n=1 Tax=Citrifermentans bemidjiense (strain ATCC BAA-1014 / DSM 16622 / JCM 12645 / Bem) TaxID=404380 RepID=B5ED91_CITBB|nr:GGDEF and EAL domain-containing protein [Citrifermentans bemidjiense]ACH37677.1 sensor diguanylate cyclase/phosphodiesterase, S-box-containing [Citrifermentans bemidjiense Bem]